MKYWIGTSGWSYSDWAVSFYPAGLKSTDWLEYYSRQFKTVEINMTFYRSAPGRDDSQLGRKTPDDFRFSLKASRQITHLKKLQKVEHDLEHLAFLTKQLKGKAGCLLYTVASIPCQRSWASHFFLEALPPVSVRWLNSGMKAGFHLRFMTFSPAIRWHCALLPPGVLSLKLWWPPIWPISVSTG